MIFFPFFIISYQLGCTRKFLEFSSGMGRHAMCERGQKNLIHGTLLSVVVCVEGKK